MRLRPVSGERRSPGSRMVRRRRRTSMRASCAGFVAGLCECVPSIRGGPPLSLSALQPDMCTRIDHRHRAAFLGLDPRRSLATRSVDRPSQRDVPVAFDALRVSPSSRIERATPNASTSINSAPPRRRRAPIPPLPAQCIPLLIHQLIAAHPDRSAVASAAEKPAPAVCAVPACVDRIVP